jgi:hypothetical protein
MSTAQELRALVAQVNKKKPAAGDMAALRDFLDTHPAVWRINGDLAEQANLNMVEMMNAPTAMKESLKHGLGAMAAELTRPGDGELERLIIRQIVGCWLRLSYVEYVVGRNTVESNFTLRQGDFWERRLSAAQRRYLRAVETLARVRRLQLPAVQVNIAEQQVNQVNTRG